MTPKHVPDTFDVLGILSHLLGCLVQPQYDYLVLSCLGLYFFEGKYSENEFSRKVAMDGRSGEC